MKLVSDAPIVPGTRVLVRCDLDVPIQNGRVEDTFRLDHNLKTLRYLQEKQARLIIMGHLDRPHGQYQEPFSSAHLRPYFNEHLGEGKYELLENLRFNPGEEKNSPEFADELASRADIYVNESFANSHRAHASMIGVPKKLQAYAGFRLVEEVETLRKIKKDPERPLVAIIGGAKIETKIPTVLSLLKIADTVLTGGRIGLDWKEAIPEKLKVPTDYVEDKDIGDLTIDDYSTVIKQARTVVWAGPMGKYEHEDYVVGTQKLAAAIVESAAFSVVGGGDTVAALRSVGFLEKMNFVSTGGGAMLEFFIKENLPGLEALGYHG